MAKASLASMSVDALLKLRDDIGKVLSSKTNELKDQLSRLGVKIGYKLKRTTQLAEGSKGRSQIP